MPTVRWNICYFDREPKTEREAEFDRIRELRWDLDLFEDTHYTLAELEVMWREVQDCIDVRDDEG